MSKPYSPDYIYYNITIRHNPNLGPGIQQAVYYSNQSDNIVPKCNDYYCSIVRFSVPGYNIPLMIFPIQNNQANPNLSTYSVTMEFGGIFYQVYLIFDPRDFTIPAPTTAIPLQKISEYYYIFEYQHMIDMMNTALATAYGMIPGPPAGSAIPYFIFDPVTQLISFICTKAGYDLNQPNPISVYLNSPLYQLVQGIAVLDFGSSAANGASFQIYVTDTGNNSYTPPNQAVVYPQLYYQIQQQFFALDNWNVFQNLVFTTSSIPIVKEYVQSSNVNNSAQTPIITDFNPYLSDRSGSFRSILSYFPQGPYRLIDMISGDPLKKVDIQVFWQDKSNNLYPVYISTGQEVNIKILFVNKNAYNKRTI